MDGAPVLLSDKRKETLSDVENGEGGKPGKISTALALKNAQEFVASHDKWKHPYYWAAWQLWGLPD